MKSKLHGGTKAFAQTKFNLGKFTKHLDISVSPFIFKTSEINFGTRLFVSNDGELKAIQESKLN